MAASYREEILKVMDGQTQLTVREIYERIPPEVFSYYTELDGIKVIHQMLNKMAKVKLVKRDGKKKVKGRWTLLWTKM